MAPCRATCVASSRQVHRESAVGSAHGPACARSAITRLAAGLLVPHRPIRASADLEPGLCPVRVLAAAKMRASAMVPFTPFAATSQAVPDLVQRHRASSNRPGCQQADDVAAKPVVAMAGVRASTWRTPMRAVSCRQRGKALLLPGQSSSVPDTPFTASTAMYGKMYRVLRTGAEYPVKWPFLPHAGIPDGDVAAL